MIEPVLLTPFIENAFRHTDLNNSLAYIKIKIEIERNILLFEIVNSLTEEIIYSKENWKTGLKSISKRLRLLHGQNYDLKIDIINNEFVVNLKLFKLTVK